MSDDDREQILQKVEQKFGENGRRVVQVLYDADGLLTVEQIEEALQDEPIETKGIRQVLYSLGDAGYARSRRHRDNETGWISFLWNLFPDKILQS